MPILAVSNVIYTFLIHYKENIVPFIYFYSRVCSCASFGSNWFLVGNSHASGVYLIAELHKETCEAVTIVQILSMVVVSVVGDVKIVYVLD